MKSLPIALIAATIASAAAAHDAPTGWSYPASCCSTTDCRAVPASRVKETAAGYVIQISNETVPYRDPRVKDSPDGDLHLCTVGGSDIGRTLCLFVPPRSF